MKSISIRILLILAVLLNAHAGLCSQNTKPEQTVFNYFESFNSANFLLNAKYLHPDFLLEFRSQIKNIINRVQEEDRANLLREYGIKTIEELDNIPANEIYSIRMSNRLKLNTEENIRKFTTFANETTHKIVQAISTNDITYEITISSKHPSNEAKLKKYTLVKVGSSWLIRNMELINK